MPNLSFDPHIYGSAKPFDWSHESLLRYLTSGKTPHIHSPFILNAFRQIDRQDFTPENHQHLAYQDKEIKLNYGEEMLRPSTVAHIIELLDPVHAGHYLQLGTGSGYLAALLGHIVGSKGRVFTIDRVQWLLDNARKNIRKYPNLAHVELVFRNGEIGLPDKAPFDGIIFSYAREGLPYNLLNQLKVGGKIIVPLTDHTLRVIEKVSADNTMEETIHGYIVSPGKEGIA